MRLIPVCALLISTAAWADTLVLRDGRSVQGTYLGGDSRKIRIAVGDAVQSFDVDQVNRLEFGTQAAAQTPAPAPARARAVDEDRPRILRPERTPAASAPARQGVEIPAATALVIRMIDDVDSERDSVGKTYRASLDEPVTVNGDIVVPRGADITAKLVDDKESGKLSGRTELTMDLVSIVVGGKEIPITTQETITTSESRTGRTAKVVGGTAALGAIIGAIAGGGKGAAIGAASGAGAGTAIQVLTKGQRVRIPAETRLSFTLQQPVKL